VGNFQSKRKTPTCITFYRNERMFGADAMALMSRKPELTFSKAYRMLGTLHFTCIYDDLSYICDGLVLDVC
jgi:molecular chaperone DnaK (HSP70)